MMDLFYSYWKICWHEEIKEKQVYVSLWNLKVWGHSDWSYEHPLNVSKNDGLDLSSCAFARVYLDNMFIFSRTLGEHISHVHEILEIFSQHGLKLESKKCCFAQKWMVLPGDIIYKEDIRLDRGKVWANMDTSAPKSETEVCSLLGRAGY